MERSTLARGADVLGGSGSLTSAPMTNKKLIASMKNAQAVPRLLTIRPADAGPAMPVSCWVLCVTEFAVGSWPGSSIDGSSVCAAGPANASATPKTNTNT